jgi:hypothetical protein
VAVAGRVATALVAARASGLPAAAVWPSARAIRRVRPVKNRPVTSRGGASLCIASRSQPTTYTAGLPVVSQNLGPTTPEAAPLRGGRFAGSKCWHSGIFRLPRRRLQPLPASLQGGANLGRVPHPSRLRVRSLPSFSRVQSRANAPTPRPPPSLRGRHRASRGRDVSKAPGASRPAVPAGCVRTPRRDADDHFGSANRERPAVGLVEQPAETVEEQDDRRQAVLELPGELPALVTPRNERVRSGRARARVTDGRWAEAIAP